MNQQTSSQLLQAFVENRSEAAFAELVRRHVDFTYSAALRMVRDSHLAEDVTQGVFIALAKSAPQLVERPVLSGWLHRTAQNIAAQTVRTIERRRAREQEAVLMHNLLSAESEASWEAVVPHLDAALGELNESDRDALLLRYFEKKSAAEMAGLLGISDVAAQKRVNRAVDRLREFFSKRNVTVGASGLIVLISANAIQAAPAGLAATIATTAFAGTAITTTSTTIALTKTIAMTTLQKALVAATCTATIILAGTGLHQASQAADSRAEIQALELQQASLAGQISQIQTERDDATNRLTVLLAENARLQSVPNKSAKELLQLRAQLAQLQQTQSTTSSDDPFTQSVLALAARAAQLNQYIQQMPDKKIPEMQLLDESDWLRAARNAKFDNDADIRQSLRELRTLAKDKLPIGSALFGFVHANNGQLPTDLTQLQPYFNQSRLGDLGLDNATFNAIVQRYTLLHTGNVSDYPSNTWFVAETAPVDKDYDSREKFGVGTSEGISTGLGESGDPDDPNY